MVNVVGVVALQRSSNVIEVGVGEGKMDPQKMRTRGEARLVKLAATTDFSGELLCEGSSQSDVKKKRCQTPPIFGSLIAF